MNLLGISLAELGGVPVREVIRLLQQDGWLEVKRKGSHRQFKHPTKPGRVTVAGGDHHDVPTGTLRNVFRQAGLDWTGRKS